MEKDNLKKNIQEFEINNIVIDTYNKIANWHNDDPNKISLKFLSLDIVENIAGSVFKHLGLEYNSELKLDEKTKEELKKAKSKEQYNQKNISDMTDDELIREIEKRKIQDSKSKELL